MVEVGVGVPASLDGNEVIVLRWGKMRGLCEFWAFVFVLFLPFLVHALQDLDRISAAVLQSLLLDFKTLFSGLSRHILLVLGSVEVLGLKLHRALVDLRRKPSRPHALPFLLALPAGLLAHLRGELHQPHLPFSNERRRLFCLLPRIAFPLNRAVFLHIVLYIGGEVL